MRSVGDDKAPLRKTDYRRLRTKKSPHSLNPEFGLPVCPARVGLTLPDNMQSLVNSVNPAALAEYFLPVLSQVML
jgi:hypothetical protein